MIVVDQSTPLRKGLDEPAEAPAGPPPPAYPGYQAVDQPPQPPPSLVTIHVNHRPEPARKRFCKALLAAVLIWMLAGIFIRSFAELVMHRHRHSSWDDWHVEQDGREDGGWPGNIPIPIEGDEIVVDCVHGDQWTPIGLEPGHSYPPNYSAKTEFDLPIHSDLLFLLSRGSLASGSVSIVQDLSLTDKDTVKASLVVHFHSRTALSRSKVCRLQRGNNENGVGVFTARWNDPRQSDRLRFEVILRLPARSEPFYIAALETSLPLFSHSFDRLNEAFEFGHLSLKGTNAPITIASVLVGKADITTTNSGIRGVFNSSGTLDLKTTNGYIHVDVSLYNSKYADPSVLNMRTTNGPISSHVDLISNASSGTEGTFHVTGKTTNAPIEVVYGAQPVDSFLNFDAHTTNSPATVQLRPEYEGSFVLSTTNLAANVHANTTAEDPGGARRTQRVEWHSNKPMLVELKNGETFNGHLVNCDNFMNITLREVYQTNADGDRFWKVKECYIRGSTIKYLRVPDTLLDAVKEEQARARELGKSARGVGGPGGRGALHDIACKFLR
ncbi:hypothetical protein EWM64_g5533 [Hericium alpestre]|uniref:Sm domain-containing protein n=1 Tax=Hericium alpestre TaxID=135208 RepID=A0A4Y9ZWA9_9AGAM|nr:hypothetical protein EWM64_g5533 [Hericium alpestre]